MIRALFFVLLDDFGGVGRVGPVGQVRRIVVWFLPRIFTDSVMVALPRIYAGDCARQKSR